jgi:hypothetical protein
MVKSGTATENSDYTLGSTVLIPAGNQSASITLLAISDTPLDELDETVVIDVA